MWQLVSGTLADVTPGSGKSSLPCGSGVSQWPHKDDAAACIQILGSVAHGRARGRRGRASAEGSVADAGGVARGPGRTDHGTCTATGTADQGQNPPWCADDDVAGAHPGTVMCCMRPVGWLAIAHFQLPSQLDCIQPVLCRLRLLFAHVLHCCLPPPAALQTGKGRRP